MANAFRDQNHVTTLIASRNDSTVIPTNLLADPSNHGLMVSDDSSGSDFGPKNAARDDNSVPCVMAVSSADGITPVALYADGITGALLINSN